MYIIASPENSLYFTLTLRFSRFYILFAPACRQKQFQIMLMFLFIASYRLSWQSAMRGATTMMLTFPDSFCCSLHEFLMPTFTFHHRIHLSPFHTLHHHCDFLSTNSNFLTFFCAFTATFFKTVFVKRVHERNKKGKTQIGGKIGSTDSTDGKIENTLHYLVRFQFLVETARLLTEFLNFLQHIKETSHCFGAFPKMLFTCFFLHCARRCHSSR